MAAGRGAHHHRDLRDDAGGLHVAVEDVGVQRQRRDALLDPGAAALDHPDHRAAGAHREIHDLDDLLAVHLAEAAAEDGDVLAEHAHLPVVDGAVAGDHAVAERPVRRPCRRSSSGAGPARRSRRTSPGSSSSSIRSRAVFLPLACWRSTARAEPGVHRLVVTPVQLGQLAGGGVDVAATSAVLPGVAAEPRFVENECHWAYPCSNADSTQYRFDGTGYPRGASRQSASSEEPPVTTTEPAHEAVGPGPTGRCRVRAVRRTRLRADDGRGHRRTGRGQPDHVLPDLPVQGGRHLPGARPAAGRHPAAAGHLHHQHGDRRGHRSRPAGPAALHRGGRPGAQAVRADQPGRRPAGPRDRQCGALPTALPRVHRRLDGSRNPMPRCGPS